MQKASAFVQQAPSTHYGKISLRLQPGLQPTNTLAYFSINYRGNFFIVQAIALHDIDVYILDRALIGDKKHC